MIWETVHSEISLGYSLAVSFENPTAISLEVSQETFPEFSMVILIGFASEINFVFNKEVSLEKC